MKFQHSMWVRSLPVGSKGPFNGQVILTLTRKEPDGSTAVEYVVKDSEKRRWLRRESELEALG